MSMGVLLLTSLVAAQPTALYQRIAADTAAGRPIVVSTYVALCDTDSQGVVAGDHPGHCRGNAERDLYWSVPSGARGFLDGNGFKRLAYESRVSKTVAARGVWKKRVTLGSTLRALGAPEHADLLVVAIAYEGPAIGAAVRDFLSAVTSDEPDVIVVGGVPVRYGGGSHLVGFLGHDYFMDVDDPQPLYDLARARTPALHRGVVALSCLSDHYFRPALAQDTSHILVLNRTFTYPSFFTVAGVLDGVVNGSSHADILDRAARRFASAQGKAFATIRAGLAGPEVQTP